MDSGKREKGTERKREREIENNTRLGRSERRSRRQRVMKGNASEREITRESDRKRERERGGGRSGHRPVRK